MSTASNVHPSFLALMGEVPLRPIDSAKDYDRASKMLDRLTVRLDSDGVGSARPLDAGESDYLEMLSLLIEDYDRKHYPMPGTEATPLDALKFLMQQHGLSSGDIGRVIGSKGTASDILHGRREMSKATILKLAERFNVDAGIFLWQPKRDRRIA